MADQDQDDSRSRKRPKKKKSKESSAEIIAGLAKLLDQNTSKKTKKKATIMEFRRDPLTGRRVYKSKYRPNRKSQGKFFTSTVSRRFSLIGNCRNVRGLGKSMIVFRLFEKLRYPNERSTKFESIYQE